MAAELGYTQGWVSKAEKGAIELDHTSLINAVASVLHIHPNELIERPYWGSAQANQWEVSAAAIIRELRRYDLAPVFDGQPRAAAALWEETAPPPTARQRAEHEDPERSAGPVEGGWLAGSDWMTDLQTA